MTCVKFREPNFRAKVSEKSRIEANPYFRLLYAETQDAAKKYLESLGLEVHQLESYDFQKWKDRAQADLKETLQKYPRARKAGKTYPFDAALWGELKEHLQDLFHGRCAYCEAWFLSVSFGDVEHFRPKAKVTDDPSHPGYYWLAYEPTNYLPSCMPCNQKAKKNRFPVKGNRIRNPDDKPESEEPLLFNPYQDIPSDHFQYCPSRGQGGVELIAGMVIGKSEKGKISIDVFDLNREWIVRERKKSQMSIRALLKEALSNENKDGLREILKRCLTGDEEYSSAISAEIANYYETMGLGSPF